MKHTADKCVNRGQGGQFYKDVELFFFFFLTLGCRVTANLPLEEE